jgi:hypothetical protein
VAGQVTQHRVEIDTTAPAAPTPATQAADSPTPRRPRARRRTATAFREEQ